MSPGGEGGVQLALPAAGRGWGGRRDVGDPDHGLVLRVPVDNRV